MHLKSNQKRALTSKTYTAAADASQMLLPLDKNEVDHASSISILTAYDTLSTSIPPQTLSAFSASKRPNHFGTLTGSNTPFPAPASTPTLSAPDTTISAPRHPLNQPTPETPFPPLKKGAEMSHDSNGRKASSPRSQSAPKSRLYLPACFARVTNFDIEKWFLTAGLSTQAEAYIREALAAPSRHLLGYVSHTIHYPSTRHGLTLKFESQDHEHAGGLMHSYRADVLCVIDQPPTVFVRTEGRAGWPTKYTPDLAVLTTTGVEICECRSAARLAQQCIEQPHLYQSSGSSYHSDAIAKHFADLGFKFAIYTDHQIHPRFCQAAKFLHAYICGTPNKPISDAERDAFIRDVREHSGIRLTELPHADITRRNELALHLIAKGQVYTSLSEADFTQLDSIRLYATPQDEEAFHQYLSRSRPHPANLDELGHRLRHGALIEINGRDYQVTHLTTTMVRLQPDDGDVVELTTQALLDLKPRIGGIRHAEKTFERMFQEAPPEYRTTYFARLSAISPYLRGGSHHGTYPSGRTTRRWYYAYTKAVKKGLSGDVAIFPKFGECGRKQLSMDAEVEAHLLDLLESEYKKPKAPSVRHIWSLLLAHFGRKRLISKRSLYRRIARLDPHSLTWRREGKRSAIRTQPLFGDSPIFGSPHGQRSFQRAHVDSTLIDLSHPNDERQTLVRMVDAFDGRTLAWHLSKESPSDDTIQALFINCVKNYGAIPAEIVCDFGPEHRTTWLQETLAALNVVLDYRPKSDPQKGGPVESSFSALARELIHNLEGNTKLMKKVRILTKAVDPRRLAVWSPQDLAELLEEYFSLKNSLPRADKPSPDDIAKASEQKYGPPPCNAASTADLLMHLCPFVDRGERIVSPRGTVRCNNRTYGIRGPKNDLRKIAGKRVKVRCKHKSPDTIYVFSESPREAFTLHCVTPTGPSHDIIEAAKEIAADRDALLVHKGDTPKDREERLADFTAATVKKEKALKKTRTAPPSPAAETAKDHSAMPSDDEIPTIHLK